MRLTLALVTVLLVLAPTASAQMQMFRHPLGYRFSYPSGWQVQQTEQGLMLLPPDAARDAQGNPVEVLALGSNSAPGITRPDDPQVLSLLAQSAPMLRQTGSAEPIASGFGAGVRLTYEGSVNGVDARRQVYVTLHAGEVVFLLHEARRDLLEQRDADAERIFRSLTYDRPANDPEVVGQWRRSSSSGSSDATGGVWVNSMEVIALHADGTVEYSSASTVSGGNAGVSILGRGDPNVQRGRYTAAGEQMGITWEAGGTEVFGYSVFLHNGVPHLKVQAPGQQARYYERIR